ADDDIITPEAARARLDAALAPYLADGWVVRDGHDYMARLTRGDRNLDVLVDLTGEVTVEEKPLALRQESGRLVAWVLLIVALLLALAVAQALGLLH
ncbi:MAG: hypothetical protein JW910_05600, partial [Anaerolineae bacterium]|nr:hypothetical protein [Anaerolineae bacterium]